MPFDSADSAAWLTPLLACPLHALPLHEQDGALQCAQGCRYAQVHSVPVLLADEARDFPHKVVAEVLDAVTDGSAWSHFGDAEPPAGDHVDAWVQQMVGATNSKLYAHLIGHLHSYPLPESPFPAVSAGTTPPLLLDMGCGWGRWSLAAARAGYRVVGLDPSLRSVLAATRVARQLGLDNVRFMVADARRLPFLAQCFSHAFSFSVLQHFPKPATLAVLDELRRVMRPGGESRLHLLNAFGLRGLQVQALRGFREARDFEVRYWRPAEMLETFGAHLGPSRLEVESFFVQARAEDREMLTRSGRALLDLSRRLVRLSARRPWLGRLADNLFVRSRLPG